MAHDIFSSVDSFTSAFASGLDSMLEHDGLGVFILVSANAGFDAKLRTILSERLHARFSDYSERYREALRHGHSLPDADDDVLVFLKLMAIGYDALQPTQSRRVGSWELQFNQLRSFRPPRMAHTKVDCIHAPFNENGFHFNKPFLRKECFWSGELLGREVELLYNKFPFMDYHGLLVPQREHNAPQFLTHDDHHYVWRICEELGENLPGLGFGYNAYGAFASVNHLHFHMYMRETALPVQAHQWVHNGGEVAYPSRVERFDNAEAAWRYIETIHHGGESYNLLYLPGEVYCMPRRMQGSYEHAGWTNGFAWCDMSGCMIAFNNNDYRELDAAAITGEFGKLSLL